MTRAVLLCLVAGCAATPTSPDTDPGRQVAGPGAGAYGPLPLDVDLDARLQALFVPDDPAVTLELALIDRVVTQRTTDDAWYAEGYNPYRIRYAVYNLRNPDIIDALADAADAGVDVQVLIEADQLDPERTWNQGDEALIARGFEFVADHCELDAETRVTADLVGIEGSGLMHLKTRLFDTPQLSTLLTGSMNPGDNAAYNEETLHLVNDPAIVARYQVAYEDVLSDRDIDNSWDDQAAINVLFSPVDSGDQPGDRILDWLSEEDEQILIMVYSLRDITSPGHSDSLVDVLAGRVAAGVPVVVITDRHQSDGYYDPTEDELRAVGVHVYEVENTTTAYTAMHAKVAVLGRSHIRVITDAANWTAAALGTHSRDARNVESALFIDTDLLDDGLTGRRYLGQWMRVLDRYAWWGQQDGEPGFWQIHDMLTALDGWPQQAVDFEAHEARTSWGETVYARGDQQALGDWGYEGPGLPLTTDEDHYPTWWSAEPATLPLGTPFEWKLVISDDAGDVSWEGGGNRQGFAQPPALSQDEATLQVGSWQ